MIDFLGYSSHHYLAWWLWNKMSSWLIKTQKFHFFAKTKMKSSEQIVFNLLASKKGKGIKRKVQGWQCHKWIIFPFLWSSFLLSSSFKRLVLDLILHSQVSSQAPSWEKFVLLRFALHYCSKLCRCSWREQTRNSKSHLHLGASRK